MFEYTPKTKDVREAYIDDQMRGEFGRLMGETPGEFDRWLAEHDRLTAKAAWDEGDNASSENQLNWDGWRYTKPEMKNPYRGDEA